MLNFCKEVIKEKNKKNKENCYFNLAPTNNADDINSYINALDYALDENNEEIHNIAVAGKYGSGKSSVIKTYFNKENNNKKYNPIYISVSSFNSIVDNNSSIEDNVEQSCHDNVQNNIERDILQQLFYQEKKIKLPLSRFKRLEKHSKAKLFWLTIAILIVLIFILNIKFNIFSYFKFKKVLADIIENKVECYNVLILKKCLKNLENIAVIVSLVAILYVVIYNFLFFIKYKFSISSFRIKNAEISLENKNNESIFDKYLDEIIYFFQCSTHKVVVIEDLDRYGKNAIPIFNKLREINSIINNAKQIDYNVKFIYSIKDDYFDDSEKRTKFFDFIIPILPVVSNGNSNEIIWKKLQKLKSSLNFDLDKKFINDISILIDNDRIINNIINEFRIFKEKFEIESMDDKKIFGMCLYKNLFPLEYAKLQNNEGRIYDFFDNKDNLLKKLTENLTVKQNEIKNDIEKIKSENLLNVKELKSLFVFYIDKENNNSYYKFVVTNKQNNKEKNIIGLNDFKTKEINKDYFTDNYNFTYNDTSFSYTPEIKNETDLFKEFGGKEAFLQRLNRIEIISENKIDIKEKELNDTIYKINNINKLSIKKLIILFGEDEILQSAVKNENIEENLNDIEKFLIKRGHIAEDYKDYMTVFYEGNLKKEDYKFVLSVKNNKPLAYDFKITNISNIIERLIDVDYENLAILNYYLLGYIIKTDKKELENKIISLIDDNNVDSMDFIDGYISNNYNSSKFVNDLIINSHNLWHKIISYDYTDEHMNEWAVRFLLASITKENINNSFINFVNNSKNIDKYVSNDHINNVIDNMKLFKIKLSNIAEISNIDFMNKVLVNNLYDLNSNMIKLFLNMKKIDIKDFKSKNLTIILNNTTYMKEYVLGDFTEYYNSCYSQEDSSEDTEESIDAILHNNNIDIEIKKAVVKNEKFDKYSVNELDLDIVNEIILEDKMDINYANILYISSRNENLPGNLARHISKHINEYKNFKLGKNKDKFNETDLNDFINKYIYSEFVSKEDLNILIKSFKYKVMKIEEINLDKLDVLINNNSIDFNVDNYDYIKKNYVIRLIDFIINNKKNFINNISEYDFSDISDILLQNDSFNRTDKMIIKSQINLTNLSSETLIQLMKEGVINTDNETINLKILDDTRISNNEKINLLKKWLNELDKDIRRGTEIIHNLQGNFVWINSYKKSVTFDKDTIDEEFCKLLKEKKYIKEYKIKPTGRITLYNYKK